MISEKMKPLVANNSVIRQMFEEGQRLAQEFGAENVFDFSIGNPNVPAPDSVKEAIIGILNTENPVKVHGYMNNAGFLGTRKAIADNLNERFGTDFTERNVIMTVGAGSAINITLKTMINPGDEVVCIAPYFVEYGNYIRNYDGVPVVVSSNPEGGFMPRFDELEEKINEKTKAVIVNNPNNPTGVIYPEEIIKELATLLERKQKEVGHPIYIISDEPYRELAYEGAEVPFVTKYYDNTIVGYSYSKSLSLPGERIGYILVPDESDNAGEFIDAATIANRVSGCVNAPSLIQLAIERCVDEKCNVEYYERNGKRLYDALSELGFSCVKPQGAFYLWMKSPVDDEKEFVQAAKKYNILMVPGSSFAGPGYVRISYCVSYEQIERSIPKFAELAKEYF
ncbi:MAG: pyridoxal phosphate-dependent aminotransferase [Firmicutes bacterium]|nr:pyridoxal phosphate-dependent aminotransferase [Bacillota bacterium]